MIKIFMFLHNCVFVKENTNIDQKYLSDIPKHYMKVSEISRKIVLEQINTYIPFLLKKNKKLAEKYIIEIRECLKNSSNSDLINILDLKLDELKKQILNN